MSPLTQAQPALHLDPADRERLVRYIADAANHWGEDRCVPRATVRRLAASVSSAGDWRDLVDMHAACLLVARMLGRSIHAEHRRHDRHADLLAMILGGAHSAAPVPMDGPLS